MTHYCPHCTRRLNGYDACPCQRPTLPPALTLRVSILERVLSRLLLP